MGTRRTTEVIKSKRGQHINQREVNLINGLAISGLLLIDVVNKKSGTRLIYNTGGLITLSDFLRMNEMDKRLFAVLLRNIVLSMKTVEENRLSKNLLMWSLQSVYVDPVTWNVYMMYVPLQPYETSGNLKTFLLDFVSSCSFRREECMGCVQTLVNEINGATYYTSGMLGSFCDNLSEELLSDDGSKQNQRLCVACGSRLVENEKVCPFCGRLGDSYVSKKPYGTLNSTEGESLCFPLAFDTQGDISKKPELSIRGGISVNEDENGVVTVFRKSPHSTRSIWLEDCERDEKIPIVKFPFRVGKMDGVTDYRIFENAVSRKHADILREQGKYYVVDLDSTNGTYLDGKKIQPGVKEELVDGSDLMFADVKFKFHIS